MYNFLFSVDDDVTDFPSSQRRNSKELGAPESQIESSAELQPLSEENGGIGVLPTLRNNKKPLRCNTSKINHCFT